VVKKNKSVTKRVKNLLSQPHNFMQAIKDGRVSEDEGVAETRFDRSFGQRLLAGVTLCSPCPA